MFLNKPVIHRKTNGTIPKFFSVFARLTWARILVASIATIVIEVTFPSFRNTTIIVTVELIGTACMSNTLIRCFVWIIMTVIIAIAEIASQDAPRRQRKWNQSQKTQGFCVADFAMLSDERRLRSEVFLLFNIWIKNLAFENLKGSHVQNLLGFRKLKYSKKPQPRNSMQVNRFLGFLEVGTCL